MADWITFWNSANSIYVNARHRDVHYRTIADDLAAYVPGKRLSSSIMAAARRCMPTAWPLPPGS